MRKTRVLISGISLLFLLFTHCMHQKLPEDPAIWNKIELDFKNIDENGLTGPPNGKVAVNYEFCLPRNEDLWKKVQKMDPSVERSPSRGRIGCSAEQWLVIGNTHQPNYKRVLYELATLPEIAVIKQTFFE